MKMTKRIYEKNESGMTLIEILIAMTILIVTLLVVVIALSSGMEQLNEQRIKRTAAECVRVVMEYMSTMPPDTVYGYAGGSPNPSVITGNFAAGGFLQLNAFVNSINPACRDLSDISKPLGSKVQLRYSICPGCISYTDIDPESLIPWTTCMYNMEVMVSWNAVNFGGSKLIKYKKKFFGRSRGSCDPAVNPDGCGLGSIPYTEYACTY